MKGKWKVTSNIIGDKKVYAAYRLIDERQPDHSGNREYYGGYIYDRSEVEHTVSGLNTAAMLNEEEQR